jgi:hypothetical protein
MSSINARCGSCNRQLLLVQLTQPSDGFRCPFCGYAFAPAYASVAPHVSARAMAAHADLVTALAELGSMTSGRLRLDPTTTIDPITNALPQAEELGPAHRQRAHWSTAGTTAPPATNPSAETSR